MEKSAEDSGEREREFMSIRRRVVLGAREGMEPLRDQMCCANQSRPAARDGRRKGSRRSKAGLGFPLPSSWEKTLKEGENHGSFKAKGGYLIMGDDGGEMGEEN